MKKKQLVIFSLLTFSLINCFFSCKEDSSHQLKKYLTKDSVLVSKSHSARYDSLINTFQNGILDSANCNLERYKPPSKDALPDVQSKQILDHNVFLILYVGNFDSVIVLCSIHEGWKDMHGNISGERTVGYPMKAYKDTALGRYVFDCKFNGFTSAFNNDHILTEDMLKDMIIHSGYFNEKGKRNQNYVRDFFTKDLVFWNQK